MATPPRAQVHAGFLEAYNSIQDDLTTELKRLTDLNPLNSLTIAGHSLGGAIATLASVDLGQTTYNVDTYTFGAPAVGNQSFSDNYADTGLDLFRYTNPIDPVVNSLGTGGLLDIALTAGSFTPITAPFIYLLGATTDIDVETARAYVTDIGTEVDITGGDPSWQIWMNSTIDLAAFVMGAGEAEALAAAIEIGDQDRSIIGEFLSQHIMDTYYFNLGYDKMTDAQRLQFDLDQMDTDMMNILTLGMIQADTRIGFVRDVKALVKAVDPEKIRQSVEGWGYKVHGYQMYIDLEKKNV